MTDISAALLKYSGFRAGGLGFRIWGLIRIEGLGFSVDGGTRAESSLY